MNEENFHKLIRTKMDKLVNASSATEDVKRYVRSEILNDIEAIYTRAKVTKYIEAAQVKADKMELKRLSAEVALKQKRINLLKRKHQPVDFWQDGDNELLNHTLDNLEKNDLLIPVPPNGKTNIPHQLISDDSSSPSDAEIADKPSEIHGSMSNDEDIFAKKSDTVKRKLTTIQNETQTVTKKRHLEIDEDSDEIFSQWDATPINSSAQEMVLSLSLSENSVIQNVGSSHSETNSFPKPDLNGEKPADLSGGTK